MAEIADLSSAGEGSASFFHDSREISFAGVGGADFVYDSREISFAGVGAFTPLTSDVLLTVAGVGAFTPSAYGLGEITFGPTALFVAPGWAAAGLFGTPQALQGYSTAAFYSSQGALTSTATSTSAFTGYGYGPINLSSVSTGVFTPTGYGLITTTFSSVGEAVVTPVMQVDAFVVFRSSASAYLLAVPRYEKYISFKIYDRGPAPSFVYTGETYATFSIIPPTTVVFRAPREGLYDRWQAMPFDSVVRRAVRIKTKSSNQFFTDFPSSLVFTCKCKSKAKFFPRQEIIRRAKLSYPGQATKVRFYG